MNNSGKLSIIIPCYNDYLYIEEAVNSALNQTYKNKEIIVVDDGSNIDTKMVLRRLEPKISKLITQENQGQSIARNNGIKQSNGEYILNLDADDYFEPTFCEKAIMAIERDFNIKIVTCKTRRFHIKGEIDIFTSTGGNINNFLFKNSAMGSSMFKRKDWERCGGYEEILPILGLEDWEFYLNILKTGGVAHVLPEVLFNYQVRENSTTAQIKKLKLDKFKFIILKHSELYKENFEELVTNFIERLKIEEREKIKNTKRIDFKLGEALLRPFRFIKSLIK
ncbi:hypothetical protein SAMN05444483_11255 [Salegentibacter echinorum]|uniref:Glycosyltransferase 2-like domain-containing protein n=1 Tax=Salegentibacter echinorum TaxID=1073325 RepID=A0A1M5JV82_SALEC|nr:glycosyltransferase family A protein [Salegentibacter echinorum]SHG44454.1 hypothetical protein SAMN05444483_11255 [Salegentibacter echinorum]